MVHPVDNPPKLEGTIVTGSNYANTFQLTAVEIKDAQPYDYRLAKKNGELFLEARYIIQKGYYNRYLSDWERLETFDYDKKG